MELFGLVSVVDDKLFGDEASFRINYGGAPTTANLAILRDRLKPICRRTLRKDVQAAGHINYTRRISTTFKFEPHEPEVRLYNGLSAYLQRKDTIAFGAKPNQLVTLVVRKILGSSTFAVADTLTLIIERLKRLEALQAEDFADIDTADEIAEEWDADDGEEASGQEEPIDAKKLKAEIDELIAYRDLARSIKVNAKGQTLLAELGPRQNRKSRRTSQGGHLHRVRAHARISRRPAISEWLRGPNCPHERAEQGFRQRRHLRSLEGKARGIGRHFWVQVGRHEGGNRRVLQDR
jgi:hypothetical protein